MTRTKTAEEGKGRSVYRDQLYLEVEPHAREGVVEVQRHRIVPEGCDDGGDLGPVRKAQHYHDAFLELCIGGELFPRDVPDETWIVLAVGLLGLQDELLGLSDDHAPHPLLERGQGRSLPEDE